MLVNTYCCRTDITLARFDGEVLERERHVVLRAPANPTYYWGNYVLFDRPPTRDDLDEANPEGWIATFHREMGGADVLSHTLLVWEGEVGPNVDALKSDPVVLGDAEALVARDPRWEIDRSVALVGESVHPPARFNPDVRVRAIESERDWLAATEVLDSAFSPRARGGSLRGFVERQVPRYRAMVRAGRGVQLGAYLGDALAATLGIFVHDAVGRYQLVGTAVEHQGRGVGATLVYTAGALALRELGARQLVIAADATYSAARVYESVGLRPREVIYGLLRAPPRRAE